MEGCSLSEQSIGAVILWNDHLAVPGMYTWLHLVFVFTCVTGDSIYWRDAVSVWHKGFDVAECLHLAVPGMYTYLAVPGACFDLCDR